MTKVSIIGFARSGMAAAQLALRNGYKVFISDKNDNENLRVKAAELEAQGAEFELGGHSDRIFDCSFIVLSPGVPRKSAIVAQAISRGIKVISEIEFGFGFERGAVVAITGSNGKSTTATLTAQLFEDAGIKTFLAGNIGNPYCGIVEETEANSITVLELSSFQLESMEHFRPRVSVLLNLTPDHLDVYSTIEDYYAAKLHIFDKQNETDFAVLNYDYTEVADLADVTFAQKLWFSTSAPKLPGAYVEDGYICANGTKILPEDKLGIPGPHNLSNALASVAATLPFSLPMESIAHTLATFKGIEHRLERFAEHAGILFVNDSKATNPDSLKFALLAFDRPLVLILGGYDKGNEFGFLRELVSQKAKAVVFTGATGRRMAEELGTGVLFSLYVENFDNAVRKAFSLATAGDVVLLSPGCASYDAFKNFEHRGRYFKEFVCKLIEENEQNR